MQYLNEMKILKALGVELSLDFDDELLIETPQVLDRHALLTLLNEHSEHLKWKQIWQRQRLMRQLVGGPFSGQRHDRQFDCCLPWFGYRVSRAKWAVYQLQEDGRAFFRGYATSQKNARQGKLIEVKGT